MQLVSLGEWQAESDMRQIPVIDFPHIFVFVAHADYARQPVAIGCDRRHIGIGRRKIIVPVAPPSLDGFLKLAEQESVNPRD